MFRIIGADGKEYGPVAAEHLRQWVIEGRLNAQTQARMEGETEWKTLSSFPEFADVLRTIPGAAPTLTGTGAGGAPAAAVLARDYSLDIGACISRAWDLLTRNFWPVVGISFLIMVISGIINQALGLASRPVFRNIFLEHSVTPGGVAIIFGTSLLGSPVYTLLMGGLFKYYLKLIRAENPTIADAFGGFSPVAGQLLLLGLVNGFLTTLAYLLCVLPGIYVSVAWIFALPLVVDRNLPFWDAMELSRKVVTKHWFIVFAFLLVVGLLGMSGLLVCCVGIFVTLPLVSVALLYAYEDIFGQKAA